MARQKVVDSPDKSPQQQAKEFAAGLESVRQAIAWIGGFDGAVREAASKEAGNFESINSVPAIRLSINDVRPVAEVLYRWKLEGKLTGTMPMKLVTSDAPAEVKEAEQPAAPTPPLAEIDQLREQVKKYQQAEEERAARTKKMQTCLARIDRAEKALVKSATELERAKGDHKSAEADLAEALNELKLTAKGLPVQLDLPMGTQEGSGSDAAVAGSPPAPPAAAPEGWRATPLASLDIPMGALKKLADHEPAITTLGELTDWQKKKGDHWATDIRGIGAGASEKIADACDAFWRQHPEYTAEQKAPATPPPATTETPAETPTEELASV